MKGPRRLPRAGHPTGTRGGTTPASGTPATRAPSLEPAGGSPLGHCGGHRPRLPARLSGGAAPPGSTGVGGVGCPRCHGDAALLAGWEGSCSPVWLRSRPRSDQAQGTGRGSRGPPGSLSSHCPACSWTTGARVFDPNRKLWVGGCQASAVRVPSGQSRGPAAGASTDGALASGQPGRRGAVGAWKGAGERS